MMNNTRGSALPRQFSTPDSPFQPVAGQESREVRAFHALLHCKFAKTNGFHRGTSNAYPKTAPNERIRNRQGGGDWRRARVSSLFAFGMPEIDNCSYKVWRTPMNVIIRNEPKPASPSTAAVAVGRIKHPHQGGWRGRFIRGLFAVCAACPGIGISQPGIPFRTTIEGWTQDALVVQTDGKILVGGEFWLANGQPRTNLVRLLPDGSVDPSYAPQGIGPVNCLVIQPDGQLLVAARGTNGLLRLTSNGSRDPEFKYDKPGDVQAIVLQPDGKMLLQGYVGLGLTNRVPPVVRLNSDGSWDSDFDSNLSKYRILSAPYYGSSVSLRRDGSIYMAGYRPEQDFNHYIGQFDSEGNVQGYFYKDDPQPASVLFPQQDRTLLFSSLRRLTTRINADGSQDLNFRPRGGEKLSLALQSDGKLVVGGEVSPAVGTVFHSAVARLQLDGGFDFTFPDLSPTPSQSVGSEISVVIEPDGSVLYSSSSLRYLERVPSSTPAFESLELAGSTALWRRSGSAPLAQRATFSRSTDGANWVPAGDGQLTQEGWQISVTNLQPGELVRARGSVFNCGQYGGVSQWFVEATARAGAPAFLRQPVNRTNHLGAAVAFGSSVSGSGPLTFQWQKDGQPLLGMAQGGLALPTTSAVDAGWYTLVVSNAFGSITSAPVYLELLSAPGFVRQPYNQGQPPGSTATLTVHAVGAPGFEFQWTKDGTNVDGATNASLVLTNLSSAHEGTYLVTARNSYGVTSSAPAVVKLVHLPKLTIETQQQWRNISVTANFTNIHSPGLTFQTSTNLVDWTDLSYEPIWLGANGGISPDLGAMLYKTNLVNESSRYFRVRME